MTFWLSAPQPETVTCRPAPRWRPRAPTPASPSCSRPPRTSTSCRRGRAGGRTMQPAAAASTATPWRAGRGSAASTRCPGSTTPSWSACHEAAPRCVVALRLDCHVEGIGVDPNGRPWSGRRGRRAAGCRATSSATRPAGSTGRRRGAAPARRPHDVRGRRHRRRLAALPRGAGPREQARLQLLAAAQAASAFTIGGTVEAVNAEHPPPRRSARPRAWRGSAPPPAPPVVLSGDPLVLEVSGPEGWHAWELVQSFADSDPDDGHFLLDAAVGVELGPACARGRHPAPVRCGAPERRRPADAVLPHRRRRAGQRHPGSIRSSARRSRTCAGGEPARRAGRAGRRDRRQRPLRARSYCAPGSAP